jgi:hypothetical protein
MQTIRQRNALARHTFKKGDAVQLTYGERGTVTGWSPDGRVLVSLTGHQVRPFKVSQLKVVSP